MAQNRIKRQREKAIRGGAPKGFVPFNAREPRTGKIRPEWKKNNPKKGNPNAYLPETGLKRLARLAELERMKRLRELETLQRPLELREAEELREIIPRTPRIRRPRPEMYEPLSDVRLPEEIIMPEIFPMRRLRRFRR